MDESYETHLKKLPFVYQMRDYYDSQYCAVNKEQFQGREGKANYFRDAVEDKVYFALCCGVGARKRRFKIRKGDTIIFNGTDENGFDMGVVGEIGEDYFQIEYLEIVGCDVRKCRNLNRLPPPEDFDNNSYTYYGNRKVKKYKMKFMKKETREEHKWFLVIDPMTEKEYVEEVVNDGMWEGSEWSDESEPDFWETEIDEAEHVEAEHVEAEHDEAEHVEAEHDEAEHVEAEHDEYETDSDDYDTLQLATNYHCHRCQGDSPVERERCRRITENTAITAYENAANDAYNEEGEYINQPTVTTWRIAINGINYLIDYNNVLFSYAGEVLGYAKPSSRQGLEGFQEPFEPVFFDDENNGVPPPPKYEE
jgi:hypothetical protein